MTGGRALTATSTASCLRRRTRPEEKLFNLRIGQSTGKVIWTYISSHTEYNREHLKDKTVRGWYSAPVEGERLQAGCGGGDHGRRGLLLLGLESPVLRAPGSSRWPSSERPREAIFEFAQKNEAIAAIRLSPAAGGHPDRRANHSVVPRRAVCSRRLSATIITGLISFSRIWVTMPSRFWISK